MPTLAIERSDNTPCRKSAPWKKTIDAAQPNVYNLPPPPQNLGQS
jgi:hypothetical protein